MTHFFLNMIAPTYAQMIHAGPRQASFSDLGSISLQVSGSEPCEICQSNSHFKTDQFSGKEHLILSHPVPS